MSNFDKSKQPVNKKDVDHKKPVDASSSSFELNLSDVNAFVQHRNELSQQKQQQLHGENQL